jgi:acetyl-CoA carboxylase carboxyltransferase component
LQIKKKSLERKGEIINKEKEQELLDKIIKKYKEQTSPYYAASRLWVDSIIDPIETRKIISIGIEAANNKPITEKYNPGIIQS